MLTLLERTAAASTVLGSVLWPGFGAILYADTPTVGCWMRVATPITLYPSTVPVRKALSWIRFPFSPSLEAEGSSGIEEALLLCDPKFANVVFVPRGVSLGIGAVEMCGCV